MEEKLIECVRAHECLYNQKLQHYKNAALKNEVWEQIGSELNATASECKTKWNLLRNAFVHAISRRKTVTGQGVKNWKKWKFEEEMSFLLPYMTHRNTVSNVDECDEDQNSGPIDEDSNESNRKQKKRKDNNNYQEQILNIMKTRTLNKSEKDDIDLFFETMAKKVKKFPKLDQIQLQFNIIKMVHEIELRYETSAIEPSASSSRSSIISTPSSSPIVRRTSSPYLSDYPVSPSYVPQSSPSPQNAHQAHSPLSQQSASPSYVPQSSPSPQNAHQAHSPLTQQSASPSYVPQSSPSPHNAYQSHSALTQQSASPSYVPQSSLSPHNAYQSHSALTQQSASPSYVPLYSPTPPQIQSHSSPQTQQSSSPMYSNILQLSSSQIPCTQYISQPLQPIQDSVIELSIPEETNEVNESPAKKLLEFLIVKKRK